MNVNPLNFVKINYNRTSIPNNPLHFEATKDVFVKSSNPLSFKGAEQVDEVKSFIQWAQETDFIKTQLGDILSNPENVLGTGFNSTAYKIPNNENYVLRLANSSLEYINWSGIPNSQVADTDLKHDINVGQEVAVITIPSEWAVSGQPDWLGTRVEVLKKQTGESIGVQPPETLLEGEFSSQTKNGVASYEDYSRKEKYIRTLKQVAQLPVESYEELISTFTKASEICFGFDHLNSNNLLVDIETKSINLIDMDKPSIGGGSVEANYANLLYSLSNISYYSTYVSSEPNPIADTPDGLETKKIEAIEYNIQIIDKFLQAMKNTGVKFNSRETSYEFYKFMHSIPCIMYCQSADDNAFWNKASSMGLMK